MIYQCPKCKTDLDVSAIVSEAARRAGRKSRRALDPVTAREMQRKSAEARKRNLRAKREAERC